MPGFNHTTENMKTKTLLGFFLLSVMAFCVSACQDDAEIILFSGSELVDETGTCTNTVSSTVLYLNGWEAENIGIANGKGGYSAQSSDETIVTATVIDNRLWLSSHGKKGKVTVTVTDKDGNYVTLPVTVSYGVLTFMCVDQPEFQVSRPSEDMLSLDSESELQEKVNVAMAPYSFINKGDICILRPDDVYHLSEEGTGGKFIYKTEDEQILVEGTYQIEWASLGGKQKKAFVFTYIDKNNVEQQHTFFNFSPYLGTQSSTRERGPITTAWLEEVSDSPYLEGVLPADRTVVYWVDTVISSLIPLRYCYVFKACSISAMISSAFSIPTDRRIRSGRTPASISCSSVSWR